jgi:hypothetical protein
VKGRYTWLHRTAAAVAAACLLTAPALAEVTIKGDRAAYDEVVAAFKKLFALPGFRMKITFEANQQAVVEITPPNGFHTTAHTSNGTMEMISTGDKSAMKIDMPGAPSGWRCAPTAPRQPFTIPDPEKAAREGTGTIDVSRGADTNIEGTPVHTYINTNSNGSKDTIYVGSQTGLPRRIVSDKGNGQPTTVDYYDYGANIVITLPPCTQ